MALDDDTFSDSDSGSSSSGDTNIFMGSSHCHGHSQTNIGGWGLVIILIVLLVVIVATSGNKSGYDSARREQQTDAMIKAWASSMNTTVASENGRPGYSCQHERARALCDVRLTNGERRHLSCGKGGCSER